MDIKLGSNKPVVHTAICPMHCPGDDDVGAVTLVGDELINEMPLFRSRVHKYGLVADTEVDFLSSFADTSGKARNLL